MANFKVNYPHIASGVHITKQIMIGQYTFIRTIDDRYAKRHHCATGTLHISQTEWRENGVLHSLGNADFYQSYILEFTPKPSQNSLCVKYLNGAVFYKLESVQGTHHIHHQCGDDTYLGTWDYKNDTLTLVWRVKGPRKDYTMFTTYACI